MSRSTDHDEDEGEHIDAEEYLQHALMNETKAIIGAGVRKPAQLRTSPRIGWGLQCAAMNGLMHRSKQPPSFNYLVGAAE
jgi:hypothetical protein